MDEDSRLLLGAAICITLVILSAVFTACENSIIEIKDSEAERLTAQGRRGRALGRLIADPNRLLTSGIILRTLISMAVSAAAEVTFARRLADAMGEGLGMLLLSTFIILCGAAFINCTLGIVLPKRLCAAGKIGQRFALRCAPFYGIVLRLLLPLEALVSVCSAGLLKLFGVKRSDLEDKVTEEEILMMVDAVNETGGIEESQAEMISNIFEFDDLEVHEIMTHRTGVEAVSQDCTIAEAADVVISRGFSRIPVYEGSIDRITGVVFAKDILRSVMEGNSKESSVKELMREIRYIPENCRCDDLLEEFTQRKIQIAVVVDEYGGTAGIVTMEDLLEAIVGSIQDEYDNEIPDIQEITPNTFDISGRAALDDVMDELGCETPEDSIHDTIGGFVTELIGHIPAEGERASARWRNISFTVISAGGKSIEKLRAVIDRKEKEDG